ELVADALADDHPNPVRPRGREFVEHVIDERQIRDWRAVARALLGAARARLTACCGVDDGETHPFLLPIKTELRLLDVEDCFRTSARLSSGRGRQRSGEVGAR